MSPEERAIGKTHLDKYLKWFYETVVLLHDLLTVSGTLYVHLDWHVGHYAKSVLDEIFGYENFVNEVVWQEIRTTKAQTLGFGNVHDTILIYAKGNPFTFNRQLKDLDHSYITSHYKATAENGRQYRTVSLLEKGSGPPRNFGGKVIAPLPGRHWIWGQDRIDDAFSERSYKDYVRWTA